MSTRLFIFILLFTPGLFAQYREFRGVKLTDVDSQVLFSEKSISEAMDFLAALNVNAVIPVVWNGGYTQYPSGIMDSLFGNRIDPAFSGRDPLETVVIEARRVGIEVYPWFEYGFSSYYSGGSPPYGGHILQKFPVWAARHLNGDICVKNGFDWMSGVNPEVQNFIIGLTMEVMRKYDVDGVEYSDRMPALPIECGYDSTTVALYRLDHNGADPPANFYDIAWKRWRADKLNNFYRRVRDSVKALDNRLFVASSPSVYPWAYDQYLQDSKTWVNSGVVDQFLPQLYRYNFSDYLYELNNSLSHIDPAKKEITFAGILMNVGSYVISQDFLLQSLQANRQAGVMGEGFFFYEGLRKNNSQLADVLRSGYYALPSGMPGRVFNRRPPGVVINEDSSAVHTTGSWESLPVPGFRGGILRTGSTTPASLGYDLDIPATAWYDLYVYLIPSISFAPVVNYTVHGSAGDSAVTVNQQNPGKQGWFKLGTYELQAGNRSVISVNNTGVPAGKYVMADAAMALINRQLSPDVVITGVEDEATMVPVDHELKVTGYPNPFNPSIEITYGLSETAEVKLLFYNALGELVSTFDEGERAPGKHHFTWRPDGFSSGAYFVKVLANGRSGHFKMLLMK